MQITREDIHVLGRNSSMGKEEAENALKVHVYSDKISWLRFIQWSLLALGVGFAVSGILFFFAYNWAGLHRFSKIGLAGTLLVAATAVALIPTLSLLLRKIALTGAAVLVGVVFATYGQVYQTGADAYDFFLAWAVFSLIWVAVSDFAPLWLLYIWLLNTTLAMYSQQVATDWSSLMVMSIHLVLNSFFLIASLGISSYFKWAEMPNWFINLLGLTVSGIATVGIIVGIFEPKVPTFPFIIFTTLALYGLGVWHGIQKRSLFFLAIIALSLIIIGAVFFLYRFNQQGMWLVVSLHTIVLVTLVVRYMLKLQKEWYHEN